MKGNTTIDLATRTARVEIALETIEDAGAALGVIIGVARALWPDIAFSFPDDDEPDEPDKAAPAPAAAKRGLRKARKKPDFSALPREGSVNWGVLHAVKTLATTDMVAIADACDLTNRAAATALYQLRSGGHIA